MDWVFQLGLCVFVWEKEWLIQDDFLLLSHSGLKFAKKAGDNYWVSSLRTTKIDRKPVSYGEKNYISKLRMWTGFFSLRDTLKLSFEDKSLDSQAPSTVRLPNLQQTYCFWMCSSSSYTSISKIHLHPFKLIRSSVNVFVPDERDNNLQK